MLGWHVRILLITLTFSTLVPRKMGMGRPLFIVAPLVIELNKKSPPFRAFETIVSGEDSANKKIPPRASINPWDFKRTVYLKSPSKPQVFRLSEMKINGTRETSPDWRGHLEVSGGLALTDRHQLAIEKHSDKGLIESFQVDPMSASYSLAPPKLGERYFAKLVTDLGETVASSPILEGKSKVTLQAGATQLPKSQVLSYSDYMSDLTAPPSLVRNATSRGRKSGKSKLRQGGSSRNAAAQPNFPLRELQSGGGIPDAESLHGEGVYTYSLVDPDGDQKTQVFKSPKEEQPCVYFSRNQVQSLKEVIQSQSHTTLDMRYVSFGAIRGSNKLPMKDVEIYVETDPQAKVFYFNEIYLPDVNRKETSTVGVFLIFDSKPGFHSLVARKNGQLVGYTNLVAQEDRIAFAEVLAKPQSVEEGSISQISSYDPHTEFPVPSKMELQGLDYPLHLWEQPEKILLSGRNQVGLAYVTPKNEAYQPAKYFYNESNAEIRLPVVLKSWVQEWTKGESVAGLIVGFVKFDEFEVFLPGEEAGKTRLVYFDPKGKIIERAKKGVKDGGFLVMPSGAGLKSVFTYQPTSKKFSAYLVPVDGQDVSILSFR